MKSYFLRKHKILKLYLLFIATIIAFILPANISYADIVVELVHVDTTQYPTIRAYVKVIDENGDLITDLTKSNFSIFEDGNEQTPESATLFPPPIDPIAVAQALDHSGSMVEANAIEDMKAAALILIDQLRTDYEDACEIVKFDTTISVEQVFTTDKDLLREAVERPWPPGLRDTKLYDATYKAIEDTASYIASQDSLGSALVVSDGKDNASSYSLTEVISLATSNGITVFTVGLGTVDAEVLQQIADETGGSYFYAATPSDLEAIFLAIMTENCGGYMVSYDTSATGCEDHILRISVTKNADFGEDSKSFLICPQDNGGNGGDNGYTGNAFGKFCFIATAAFGSYIDPSVQVLRDFRDRYLLTNPLGEVFVRFYYEVSPPLANYIREHQVLRTATRLIIMPVVYGVKYLNTSIVTLLSMLTAMSLTLKAKRRATEHQ